MSRLSILFLLIGLLLISAGPASGQTEESAGAEYAGSNTYYEPASPRNPVERSGEEWAETDEAPVSTGAASSAPGADAAATCPECGCKDKGKDGCPQSQSHTCDCKKKKALKAAVAGSHKPLFYDNKFDYVCDPCYCDWWPGDEFKRMCICDCAVLDIGGQYRARLQNEGNLRGLGLTGNDDDFLLHRTRLFANAEFGGWFRAYAEYIDAESNYEDFAPRAIEVNRSDFLNLFGDLKLYEVESGDIWARAGRQELLYGNQRTISPLDWANTRRTFEGYKAFHKGKEWDVDAFYTRPIFADPKNFDSPDYDQEFMGLYATYKGQKDHTYDFYYIAYNNGDAQFKFDTIGARWLGAEGDWLWEFEGAYQFGGNSDGSNHVAGFWVAGVGRKFDCCPWKPVLWFFYDWASGADELGAGNGYHHLFPLSHKYMGFMDLFGRRNIETPNVQLTLTPHEKVKVLLWYYYLFLENPNDTPYSVTMTPFNPANAPASRELGQEIDLTVTCTINPRASILFGYSHFFAGDYYKLTPGVPHRGDADFFYTDFTFNF
jgi:hypothetical protein